MPQEHNKTFFCFVLLEYCDNDEQNLYSAAKTCSYSYIKIHIFKWSVFNSALTC